MIIGVILGIGVGIFIGWVIWKRPFVVGEKKVQK
jgi:hypothetical protein